ncbi:MAG TPA: CHRD domain-containing protein [Rhodanobacteraceae bacterium]|nr:CHRD domain-containing protein [Rhodanobacteraceae bacterium]
MKNWLAAVSLGVVAGFAVSAVADDNDQGGRHRPQRVFRAELVGVNEVPSVSTAARGQFYAVVNSAETELRYWLRFSPLTGATVMSHIHFSQHHVNGGISAWLCEGTTQSPSVSTPPCVSDATIEGVITSLEVIGPADRGIAPGEFAELLAAMRSGAAYANVHSATWGGGEIRGQIH